MCKCEVGRYYFNAFYPDGTWSYGDTPLIADYDSPFTICYAPIRSCVTFTFQIEFACVQPPLNSVGGCFTPPTRYLVPYGIIDFAGGCGVSHNVTANFCTVWI